MPRQISSSKMFFVARRDPGSDVWTPLTGFFKSLGSARKRYGKILADAEACNADGTFGVLLQAYDPYGYPADDPQVLDYTRLKQPPSPKSERPIDTDVF